MIFIADIVVQKIPIFTLVVLFVFYILIHSFIGYLYKKHTKDKLLKFLFRWFPAFWVIIVLMILWNGAYNY